MTYKKALRISRVLLIMLAVLSNGAQANTLGENINTAIDKFDVFVFRISELCRKHCDTISTTNDVLGEVEKGLNTLNGDAFVFNQSLIDQINSDAQKLEKLKGAPPSFTLITPEREQILQGADYDAIFDTYQAIEKDREEYARKLDRWREKRDEARAIFDDAEQAYQRVIKLEQSLKNVLESAAAPFLQVVYRFDLLLLDVKVPLTEAIIRRSAAAYDLKDSYEKAVAEMEANLRRTEALQQWMDFMEFQKAFSPPEELSGDLGALLGTPIGGEQQLAEASGIVAAIRDADSPTEESLAINSALDEMKITNEHVRKEAERLWREAAAADREKARAEMVTGMLQSGVAMAGAFAKGSGSGAADSTSTSSNSGFYYKYEYTEMAVDPQGNIILNQLRFEGGAGDIGSNPPAVLPDPG